MIKRVNNELLILIIGRVLQIIIALVSIKIVTKYLEPSEMGNLYLLMSIVSFYGLFLVNPIGQYINRYTHQWYEEKNILGVLFIFNVYLLLVCLCSVGITYALYHSGIGNGIELLYFTLVIALFIYFSSWNQTIIPMINMLEGRIVFVLFTLLTQILTLISAVYFINSWEEKGVVWFFGQIISLGVVAVLALIYFTKKMQSDFNIVNISSMIEVESFRNILKFSLPLSVGVLFLWMQTQSYGIIIEKYIGAEYLGYFGVGIAISLAISGAFESVIMQYLYPAMYKSMKDENKFETTITDILNLVIPIYFLLAIFVSIFAVYIMSVLVDAKYHDSYIYLIFGIWIAFFKMSANMIANIAHAKLKTKKLIFPYIIGGVLSVCGVILAAQSVLYQYLIPIALLLASALSFLAMFIWMNKLINIRLQFKILGCVILYSVPFLAGLLFYEYAHVLEYSSLVIIGFGAYFLYVLYMLIKKRAVIE